MSTQEQSGHIPPLTLGWRLRMSLETTGISVQEMADELGVERRSPSRWMHDQGTPPRSAFVKVWALKTGVPYEWLATGIEPDDGPEGGGDQQKPSSARVRGTICHFPSREQLKISA